MSYPFINVTSLLPETRAVSLKNDEPADTPTVCNFSVSQKTTAARGAKKATRQPHAG
jgi:hypothetical protein